MRISHFTALLLACVLLFLPTVGLAVPSSLSVAVVADDHLALRPLELNQRDVVSLLGLVYEGLFEMDDNAQPQPKLAYAYSFSNDGRKLQVTLRQDVTFHNGEALTSADVIATLDYMLELSGFDDNLDSETPVDERGLYYSTFYSIRSWEATDDYTVVFTLRRASYGSLYALTFPILPVSQVASDMPSGTGPYKYDGYEQGSAIWLTANDAWWNRAPQVRYIRASIYDTADQALNAFDTQSVDIAMTRSINASRYSGSLNTFSLNARTNAANKIVDQLAAVGIPAYVATWPRADVQTKLVSGDYSLALCGLNFDVSPDPGFTLTSTASCNYTRYRSNDMNDLITQLRKSYTADSYQSAMRLIQDQFEQDQPYICLYWRSAVLLSRETFTDVRDVRELEMLRGIENYGN